MPVVPVLLVTSCRSMDVWVHGCLTDCLSPHKSLKLFFFCVMCNASLIKFGPHENMAECSLPSETLFFFCNGGAFWVGCLPELGDVQFYLGKVSVYF